MPKAPIAFEDMTKEELEASFEQAEYDYKHGHCIPLEEAFANLRKKWGGDE